VNLEAENGDPGNTREPMNEREFSKINENGPRCGSRGEGREIKNKRLLKPKTQRTCRGIGGHATKRSYQLGFASPKSL